MAGKSKLAALLTGDHLRRAELAERAGEPGKAAELYARGGDYGRAIALACRAGSNQGAIRYAFKAALGEDSGVPSGATARQAGELLKASGLLAEALLLFQQASAYGDAGEVAAKLRQPVQAAELYEKAGDWGRAAIYFESAQRWSDAVRMLGLRSRALQRRVDELRDPQANQEKREIDDRRAALLAKLGRRDEAARVVSGQAATPQSARLLEQAGRALEAFEAYLEMGDNESAYHVTQRMESASAAQRADLLQRCGHSREAAACLCEARRYPQAARLLEAEQRWAEAGRVWELAGDSLAAGTAYRRGGDYDSAGRCFEDAGKPDLAADAYSRLGRHSDAVSHFLQAGQTGEAARSYERNHQYVEAARYYLQAGARREAVAALRRIRPGAGDYDSACLKIGTLLLEDGQAQEALESIRRVSENPREVGTAALDRIYWEGRCLEALDRRAEALERYRALAAIAPGHEDVGKRLGDAGAAPEPVSANGLLAPGVEIAGRYRIEGELGRGGMGRVYRAHDRELDDDVAIKVVLESAGEGSPREARLIREIQLCRRITHPSIVRMHDIGRYEGGVFISMELLDGEDLASAIAERAPIPLKRCGGILADVLAGLREAHAQGIIHRDLKPNNIFLTPDRAKILDFGIAHGRHFDTRLTATGQAMGTPLYMAPEQLKGKEVDERTDLYSLGLVAYEMLCGRSPFEPKNPAALALDHIQTRPPDLRRRRPGLPDPWAQFVHRLLAKAPAGRLPSAAHALNVVLGLPVS